MDAVAATNDRQQMTPWLGPAHLNTIIPSVHIDHVEAAMSIMINPARWPVAIPRSSSARRARAVPVRSHAPSSGGTRRNADARRSEKH